MWNTATNWKILSNNITRGNSMKGFAVAFLMTVLATTLSAQQRRWEKPTNLQVLPSTTTGREVRQVMQGFTGGLGVRCDYCHALPEGREATEADFASDDKPEKDKARTMLKMVSAINSQYIAEIKSSLQVTCITCHRGSPHPVLLEDKLKRTYDASGLDSTISQYKALKEQYYGGFTYNFKEGTLLRLADKIMEDTTKRDDAIHVLKLNIELFPEFPFSYVHLASVYEDEGNMKAALENYEQAVKLNPNDERLQRQLERIRKKM
jgi:tetratricopeptide (TPR) repeat protein